MVQNNEKIKIVRIIARLNIGGPAIHTIILSESVDPERYETCLVVGKPDAYEGDMAGIAKSKKINLVYVPELSREIRFYDIIVFFKLLRLLMRIKPDIVHTHTAKAGALGRIAAILAGVPVRIHTFHGHVFDGYFSPFKARIFMGIERFLSLFTTKTIVVSRLVQDEIVERLKVVSHDKCVVVELGLELERFLNNGGSRGAFRKRLGVSDETLLVGMIGRLVPIKNHLMFLDVVDAVKKMHPEVKVKFILIGDGEMRDMLKRRAAEMGLADDVVFAGWIDDLVSVYADLDVVALTSLNEGTPVSLIEAMASGKPVIATDVGGVRDIVCEDRTGFLARSGDAKGFSEKLLSLLKDEERRHAMGRCGREFVRGRHSKERLVRDIEDLYGSCLNDRGHKVREGIK